MPRRRFWAALLSASVLIGACGSGSPGATGTGNAGEPPTGGPTSSTAPSTSGLDASLIEGKDVSITVWQHTYPPFNEWTQDHIDSFQVEHPNVDVTLEIIPFEEYNQKILTALGGGQAPQFFEADDYTIAQFMDTGVIAPLDPGLFGFDSVAALTADFEGNSLDLVTRDGQLYGIPYDASAPIVGYNIELFSTHGIDPASLTTWEQAMTAAATISELDGGNLITSGFALVHNIDSYYQIQGSALLKQAGASVLNDDQSAAAINSPEAAKVFELWRDAVHKYKATSPGFTSTFYTAEFGEGRVGMGFMLAWAHSTLTAYDYKFGEQYGVIRMPTFAGSPATTTSYAWNWTQNTKNTPEESVATQLLMDHLSRQGDTYLTKAGLVSPRKGWQARLAPDLLEPYETVIESIVDSEPVRPHARFNEMWAPVIDIFKAVEADANADIPALLAGAEEEINQILAQP